ncbi:hypothetical protein QTN25_008923 [Entamoeba marina]
MDYLSCLEYWKDTIDCRLTPFMKLFLNSFVKENGMGEFTTVSDLVATLKKSPLENRLQIITFYQTFKYLVATNQLCVRLYYPKTTCPLQE